ncbi:MAG: hypothetical protein H6737_31880 [Alphaproteobacteria bacterium]|nr:hypothetical protein [Alphaproteobacteria bacterium]
MSLIALLLACEPDTHDWIVVAERDVPAGTALTTDDVEMAWVFERDTPVDGYFDVDAVIGRTLGRPLLERDPVRAPHFEPPPPSPLRTLEVGHARTGEHGDLVRTGDSTCMWARGVQVLFATDGRIEVFASAVPSGESGPLVWLVASEHASPVALADCP